jgi:ABC-type transport system involved in cytochrome c biogenesis permease subunit
VINKEVKTMRIFAKKHFVNLLISFCVLNCTFSSQVFSSPHEEKISVEQFGKITVLESGRKKPLDTFARNKLMQYSGKQKNNGSSALIWLTRVFFNPLKADEDLIFLINNPDVADALGITPRVKRRYNFAELHSASEKLNILSETALKKDHADWSSFDKEIIMTKSNFQDYLLLRSIFSFSEPHNYLQITDTTLSNLLGLSINKPLSYLQLMYRGSKIAKPMQEIKNKNSDSLTSSELAVVMLAKRMYEMEKTVGNPQPHIIPEIPTQGEEWYSLWGLLNRYHTDAMTNKYMNLMFSMREAYIGDNQQGFDDAVQQYRDLVTATFSEKKIKVAEPAIEIVYNKINPFLFSKIVYGIAALLSLLTLSSLWKRAYHLSMAFCTIGLLLHTFGLILRMIIMSHPPVTNLYETFVFTAWVSVILGFILEWIKIRSLGIVVSSVTGFIFLHIAARYSRDGDTLGMLAAVLDSSFWLTTHIVTIALGYAGFVAAGLIGHIYLFQKVFTKTDEKQLHLITRAVYGIFIFGFIFTLTGTFLGGLWADQSWGRFWGWDPKENGALLIILWGLIVLHSRLAGLIKNTGLAVGAVIGVVLVMCTWIGVNLLGIGLHSYGFSSTGASAFFMYIGLELLFLTVSGTRLYLKSKRKVHELVKSIV